MREFVENKTRKPTEVNLFDEPMMVDLKSTDCVHDYTAFILKRVYKKRFGHAYSDTVYVDRKNGNMQVSGAIASKFWSVNTVTNIKNFINAVLTDREDDLAEEAEQEQQKRKFADDLIRRYPSLKFDEPDVNGNYVTVDVNINGIDVTIDSDWEVQYGIPETRRNAEKILEFLQRTHFDDIDEDDE